MLSAIWIALAVIFIGGERAARVAFALSRKLPLRFRRRPVAARAREPRAIGNVRWR